MAGTNEIQRQGIASKLVQALLDKVAGVRSRTLHGVFKDCAKNFLDTRKLV